MKILKKSAAPGYPWWRFFLRNLGFAKPEIVASKPEIPISEPWRAKFVKFARVRIFLRNLT